MSGKSRRSEDLMDLRRCHAETKHPDIDGGLDFIPHLHFRP